MNRLTQHAPNGASLILDNPQNAEEARQQVTAKFKLGCNRLAAYEDTGLSPEEVAKLRDRVENKETWEYEQYRIACKEILRLQLKLAEAKRREQAAAKDFESAAHDGGIWCEFCGTDCTNIADKMSDDIWRCGRFTWRGHQGGETDGN